MPTQADSSVLIETISALIIAIVSSFVTFLIAKYNFQKPRRRMLLESQYNNVVAPIHKILFFICSTKEDKIDAARSVVSRYYGDTPIKLLEYLANKNELIKNEEQFEAFIEYINSLFFEMKYRLGFDFKKDSLPEFTLNLKTSTTPSSSPPGGIIVSTDKDGNTIISTKIEKRKISKNKKDEPIAQEQQCYGE